MKNFLLLLTTSGFLLLGGCVSSKKTEFWQTVPMVDRDRFMGRWYVISFRGTFLEEGAHNAVEVYTWNEKKSRIDIDFKFNKGSLGGKTKSLPQRAKIVDGSGNAHWKVNPFLWFEFDYLVIALGKDYDWTVIGVPDQKYVWIMARKPNLTQSEWDLILKELKQKSYNVGQLVTVPHG